MSVNRSCFHFYFPEELIVNILKRLPVKSLLRFMSVCKLWYSLIKNPNFISSHFNHHSNEGPKYLMYRLKGDDSDRYRVYADADNFDMHLEVRNAGNHRIVGCCNDTDSFDMHLEFRHVENRWIVGCCNGIICYRNCKGDVVLWNSSVRKSLEIKKPEYVSDEDYDKKYIYWFGFDVASNDYKVMLVGYVSSDLIETTSFGVYMYSLNERTWRTIDSSFEMYKREGCQIDARGVYLDGVIHWVALTRRFKGSVPESVLTFNLADETFNTFKLPMEIEYVQHNRHLLDVVDFSNVPLLLDRVELMTVKRGSENHLVAFHEDFTNFSLWVLEYDEGCWINEFCTPKSRAVTILNYRANGDIVVQLDNGFVISSNYQYDKIEVLSSEIMYYVGDYMENLSFLLN